MLEHFRIFESILSNSIDQKFSNIWINFIISPLPINNHIFIHVLLNFTAWYYWIFTVEKLSNFWITSIRLDCSEIFKYEKLLYYIQFFRNCLNLYLNRCRETAVWNFLNFFALNLWAIILSEVKHELIDKYNDDENKTKKR